MNKDEDEDVERKKYLYYFRWLYEDYSSNYDTDGLNHLR